MKQGRKVQRSIPRQMTCDLFRDSARCSVCSGDIFNTSSSPSGWIGQLLTKRWPRRRVSAARSAFRNARRTSVPKTVCLRGRESRFISANLVCFGFEFAACHLFHMSHGILHHAGRDAKIFFTLRSPATTKYGHLPLLNKSEQEIHLKKNNTFLEQEVFKKG